MEPVQMGLQLQLTASTGNEVTSHRYQIFSKAAARAERLIKYDETISQVVPVMLTLHAESVRFIGAIPLVPIHKFRSFIMDVKGFLPEMYVIASSASGS